MTKTELLTNYRHELARYAWANDPAKVARMMTSAERTIRTLATTWNHDGDAMRTAWRALGGKGRPTLKAMRALPD